MRPNGKIIKQAYDAFGRGDMPTVFGILGSSKSRGSMLLLGRTVAPEHRR